MFTGVKGLAAGRATLSMTIASAIALSSCSKPALAGDLSWHLGQAHDDFKDTQILAATAFQSTDSGGTVGIEATCSKSSIFLTFEYHPTKKTIGHFETDQTGRNVHVPFRFDNGPILDAVSTSDNSTNVDTEFAYQLPNDELSGADPSAPIDSGESFLKHAFSGVLPHDLPGFLRSRQVRFQLPLSDGEKSVVTIAPHAQSFLQFVTSCGIDLNRLAKIASNQLAQQKATAAEAIKQKEVADKLARDEINARATLLEITKACEIGGTKLRVTQAIHLEAPDGLDLLKKWPDLQAGEIVVTRTNFDSILGFKKCDVRYLSEGKMIEGFLPASALRTLGRGEAD